MCMQDQGWFNLLWKGRTQENIFLLRLDAVYWNLCQSYTFLRLRPYEKQLNQRYFIKVLSCILDFQRKLTLISDVSNIRFVYRIM